MKKRKMIAKKYVPCSLTLLKWVVPEKIHTPQVQIFIFSQEGWKNFRRGAKILGGVQVICNMPFVMLREGHEMANQSLPGGWSKILEGLNTF